MVVLPRSARLPPGWPRKNPRDIGEGVAEPASAESEAIQDRHLAGSRLADRIAVIVALAFVLVAQRLVGFVTTSLELFVLPTITAAGLFPSGDRDGVGGPSFDKGLLEVASSGAVRSTPKAVVADQRLDTGAISQELKAAARPSPPL